MGVPTMAQARTSRSFVAGLPGPVRATYEAGPGSRWLGA